MTTTMGRDGAAVPSLSRARVWSLRTRLAVLASVVALSSCVAQAATPASARIAVPMTEFSFGTGVIDAPARRPLTLVVTNAGKVDHDLVIEQLGVSVLLRPGRGTEVTLPPLAPGTYAVVCTIPTHRESGMVATLLVR